MLCIFLLSNIYCSTWTPLSCPCHSTLTCNEIESGEHIFAVSCLDILIINIYLPTNCRNENSDSKFLSTCKKVCRLVKKVEKSSDSRVIIIGDFNCDLTNKTLPRSQLLWSSIPPLYSLVKREENFTYIGTSSSILNLNHTISSFPLNQAVVLREGFCCDHLLICVYFECINASQTSNSKKMVQYPRLELC